MRFTCFISLFQSLFIEQFYFNAFEITIQSLAHPPEDEFFKRDTFLVREGSF
jgi:hypothetical protein